jgi:GTPase SAR1 family protein
VVFFRWVFLGFFGWVFLGGFFNANPETHYTSSICFCHLATISFFRFRSITQSYYRSAHALILVYDVSNQPTFDCCPDWLREIEEYASSKVRKTLFNIGYSVKYIDGS